MSTKYKVQIEYRINGGTHTQDNCKSMKLCRWMSPLNINCEMVWYGMVISMFNVCQRGDQWSNG